MRLELLNRAGLTINGTVDVSTDRPVVISRWNRNDLREATTRLVAV